MAGNGVTEPARIGTGNFQLVSRYHDPDPDPEHACGLEEMVSRLSSLSNLLRVEGAHCSLRRTCWAEGNCLLSVGYAPYQNQYAYAYAISVLAFVRSDIDDDDDDDGGGFQLSEDPPER